MKPPRSPSDPSPQPGPHDPESAGGVLDADVLAWLDQAATPAAPDPAAQARVRQKLLRRIAADSTPRHVTVPPTAGDWLTFGPGVTMKVLHRDGGTLSYLLRLQPGASLPPHRHPQDEECLVLEGEMRVGDVVLPPGGYHMGRGGILHDRLWSPGGALIFLRGAEPELAHAI